MTLDPFGEPLTIAADPGGSAQTESMTDPDPTQWKTPGRLARLQAVIDRSQPTLTVVVENVHDPHNVAAIMRSCDAVGIREMHLVYTYEEFPNFSRIGKSSSSGARKWLRCIRHRSITECYDALHRRGFTMCASTIAEDTADLYGLDLARPTAIVIGNEHRGISPEGIAGADVRYTIPMMGMVQSLNVSVATAVTLYEALRQRRAAGAYESCSYPPGERERLLREWAAKQ